MDPESSPAMPGEETAGERSSLGTLATVLLSLFVIVLILLFWRSCATDETTPTASAGASIQSVDGLDRAGGVAVWVRPGHSIAEVLARHGLEDASSADMGNGTYVIGVAGEDQEMVVEELKDDPGLYDAGFVYLEQ